MFYNFVVVSIEHCDLIYADNCHNENLVDSLINSLIHYFDINPSYSSYEFNLYVNTGDNCDLYRVGRISCSVLDDSKYEVIYLTDCLMLNLLKRARDYLNNLRR